MSIDIRQTDMVGKSSKICFCASKNLLGEPQNKKPPQRVLDFPRSRLCSGGLDHAP